jgi:glycosyltransferase involved in cell wall biosynthesis
MRRVWPRARTDAQGLARSRLLVIEPGYRGSVGHHHALNHLLLDEASRLGHAARVLSCRYLGAALMHPLVRPTFRAVIYEQAADQAAYRQRVQSVRRQTALDLWLAHIDQWRPDQTVLLHTTSPAFLLALLEGLHRFGVRSKVHVFLMLPPEFMAGPQALAEAEATCRAVQPWLARCPARLHLWAETELLRQRFEALGWGPIGLRALPGRYPALPSPRPATPITPARPCRFVFMGPARDEKGFDLLVRAAPLALACGQPVELVLRVTRLAPHHEAALRPLVEQGLVLQVEDFIAEADYFQALAEADVALLPYDPVEYRVKNSNIVSEALAMGVPVVVPPGPNALTAALHSLHAGGAGVEMPAYTPEGLVAAMLGAAARLPAMQQEARAAAAHIRHERDLPRFLSDVLR